MFGVGPGALVSDAFMMGINPVDQRRRMNEGLEAVIRLMRGETVSMETDWFKLCEARLQMPPYTRPHIEMAVAAARSPAGASAAGRWGLGMLSIGGTSDEALQYFNSNWKSIANAWRKTAIRPTGASLELSPRCMSPRPVSGPSRTSNSASTRSWNI
jgi:alkanesulfonate monooxygenase SsuD/methylene tetrahydromethanopterin reductase-like flavin-dependent oxidoreductase (luciferase family)